MTDQTQAPEFQAALTECCERVLRGEALEECLLDYPAYRDDLARLVPLSSRVAALAGDPSPAFRERLGERLLAEVDAARSQRAVHPWWRPVPLLRPLGVALLLLLLVGGTGITAVQASENSLPDSPLYGVKTVKEWAERRLARGEETIAIVNTRQVDARNREIEETVRQGKPREVMDALARRVVETAEPLVARALAEAAAGNPRPALRALQQIDTLQERLNNVARQASPEMGPAFQRIRSYLQEQEGRLRRAARQGASPPATRQAPR